MSELPPPPDVAGLPAWFEAEAGSLLSLPGDVADARQRLAPAWGDDAAIAQLRLQVDALSDGGDLSRLDDHALLDKLAAAIGEQRLREPALRRSLPG